MSASPFILIEISGAAPSVSVKETLDRSRGESEGGVASLLETELTGIYFFSVSLPLHFCLHCTRSRMKDRAKNSTALPILDHCDHNAQRKRWRRSRTTPTPPSRQIARGGTIASLPLNKIRLFGPSLEYARPPDVTPTLNGYHRRRATDGRTHARAGRTGRAARGRARALY